MYCPEHMIFGGSRIHIWMYGSGDIPRDNVPLNWWLNPFRYELIIMRGGNKATIINRRGLWHVKVSNLIYRAKTALGLVKPYEPSLPIADDMCGLYGSVADAYRAGRDQGAHNAFTASLTVAAQVSSECETAKNDAGFHAAESICARISNAIDKHSERG